MTIDEDPRIQEFLCNRTLAKGTARRYLITLQHYCNATGLTPTELIDQAENEEDLRLRMRERSIKKHFQTFKQYIEDRGFSPLNVSTSFAVIRTWYNDFEIQIPRFKISHKNVRKETIENLPNKDNIKHALKFSNLKFRAIILLMLSSGMGTSEIIHLTYNDFLKSIETYVNHTTDVEEITTKLTQKYNNNELIVGTWHIIRFKTKHPYYTFNTYESIDAILTYLQSDPPKDENSYLFRGIITQTKITSKTFSTYFTNLNKKCGFGIPYRQIFFRSHNLRKFFASTLFKNKIPELVTHHLLGHHIDTITEAYFKADIESLKNQYITCISDLSIKDTEVHTMKSPEFIKVESELNETQRRLKRLEDVMEGRQLLENLPDPIDK
jgi:integrase